MNSGTYRYRVVDVFTDKRLEGNSLAVFPNAGDLDAETMQKIARELNLSETTFVVPTQREGCAARVRIFTPRREMTFAGHPTIGTSYVLLDEGYLSRRQASFALELNVGAVPVRVGGGTNPLIWLTTPPIEAGQVLSSEICGNVLGLGRGDLLTAVPQVLSAGNPTLFIAVKDEEAVDRASFDMTGVLKLKSQGITEPTCVFVFTPTARGAYSRLFAPELGIPEDAATGSSTGPLARYMIDNGLTSGNVGARFISEQGTKMGRRSILHVSIVNAECDYGIEVGGNVAPVASATMSI